MVFIGCHAGVYVCLVNTIIIEAIYVLEIQLRVLFAVKLLPLSNTPTFVRLISIPK